MSNKGDGIGTIFINNKNYKGLKVGTSLVKRKYNIPDENGYTVLKIKCSTGSNILNIFNQLTSNIESVEIFNESNININANTTLPNLNVDNNSTSEYTTWTLPNGNYKVFIKGEFSIKDSTCEILKIKLQNNLTTGYKMFYNCNIVKANSDYGIKIPDLMTNTESMFENSNIDHTAEINLLTTTKCSAMYKNCTNLKKIHINYIETFNNENVLCPNLSESDYDECFFGCGNIKCGNLNSNTNNKPAIFSWANIPYSWGGLGHFNVFEIETNDANGLTLTLAEHLFEVFDSNGKATNVPEGLIRTDWGDGTIDNELSHTYSESGTYIVKTRLQPNNVNTWDPDSKDPKDTRYNKLIKKVINARNDIDNFMAFCAGCINMEQFNIDNEIHPIDMTYMFEDCSSLTSIDVTKFDITNTFTLGWLFNGCTSLNTIIGLEDLNAENVIVMLYVFTGTSITNADLSKWNCKNISMHLMGLFYGCHKLQSVDLTGWDISRVMFIAGLFNECYELTSIKGIENWNTSGVFIMDNAFSELRALKTLDLSNWNVSSVMSMNGMFEGCSSLETLGDLSNWTTPDLTDTRNMFNNVSKIKSLKLTNFDTSKVTQATNMFNGCTSLKEYDIVITFGDNTNMPFDVTSFDKSIKYITIKGTPDETRMTSFVDILKDQTDTGAILDISQLSDEIKSSLMGNATLVNNARAKGWTFRQYSLDNLEHFNIFEIEANSTNGMSLTLYENPEHSGDITAYATDWGDGTINNESSHTYSNPGSYTIKTKLQSGSNALANNNIIECKNIRNDITNMESFFCNFKALSKVSSIPNGITNMVRCFKNCTAFNQSVILPNTVKEIIYIFDGCSSFNKPLIIPEGLISLEGILKNCTSFNQSIELPSSITNLNFAFYNCSSFNQQIIIPGSVTSLRFSLQGCSSFNKPITIPNGTTNIGAMFRDCTSFNQSIIIPDSVENMEQTFYGCNSLNSPITIGSGVTNMIAAFHQCGVFNQDIEIPNSATELTRMLCDCNSYNSLVTFNLTSDSNQTLDEIFLNTNISNIKIKGEITNAYMNRILGILDHPTTIDILELSNPNILSIIEDETIMNTINAGIGGTPHTLLWAEPTYNYFIVEPDDTRGLTINLYENEPLTEPMSTLSLSGNQTDWGDGNIDENSTHTYTAGKYLVKTKLQSMNNSVYNDYWKNYKGDNHNYMEPVNPITKCMSIRRDIDNMDCFLCGNCIHLTYVCEIPENITSMLDTFGFCGNFNQKFNIPNNVTNIDYILADCHSFNQTLEIPDSVTSMESCFMNCYKFNKPIIIPNGVTNVSYMLYNCEKFNQALVIPNSVINAEGLFSDCTLFNQPVTIPSSVIYCNYMFEDCISLNQPITFEEGSNARELEMFLYACTSFNQPLIIPDGVTNIAYLLGGWMNGKRVDMAFNSPITIPDSVTDMSWVFYNCTSFNQPVHISNNCTTMEACFNYCHQFNQPLEIPLSVTDISYGIYNCAKMESKVTFNFNAESTINFDTTSFFSSPIKAVKIKGYCSNNKLINLSDNLSASPATIDIMELSNANILSIIEDTNVKTSIDSKGHTLLWAEPTYNYFVVQPNATNEMSLTLYENNDKSGDISAYSVDWGDGTIDNNSSHTYLSENKYLVKTKLQPNNINTWDPNADNVKNYNTLIKKVINVRNDIDNFISFCAGCTNMEQFNIDNTIHPIDMTYMFDSCSSLTSIDIAKFDTTNTINLGLLFYRCTSLNTIIGLENLNVENVQVMDCAFAGTKIVNADLSKWNLTKLTSIEGLFGECEKLQSVDLTGWDISRVKSFFALFSGCYELTSIKGIEDWDTSNVISMMAIFAELRALKTLDLSKWNTSKVTNMLMLFNGCSSLETLKLTNFDTSNVQAAISMFNGCTSLKEYDIVITFGNNNYKPFDTASFDSSIKYITIKGTPDIDRMTSFVDILKDQTATGAILDISRLSDEIKTTLMANTTLVDNAKAKGWIFRFNTFEIEANDTNGLTLTLAEHLIETFNDDGTTTTTPEGLAITDWGDGTINKKLSHTYNEPGTYIVKTTLQPNNVNTWDPNNKDPKDARCNKLIKKVINARNDIDNFMAFCAGCTNMEQFNIDNTIHPIDMTYMFDSCSSLTSIDMTKFDTTNTFTLGWLFNECTSLNTIIGLEDLKAENVLVTHYAFAGTSITNANLSKWNCKKIMQHVMGLFSGCHKLQSVDLTGWDISNVNVLMGIFYECYELTSIKGIEDWNTSNVVVMANIFSELRALKTLDLSKWNVSKVESMYEVFKGCSSLETLGDLSSWTTPKLYYAEGIFNGDSKLKSLKLTNFDTSNVQAAANMFNGCTSLEEYDIVITFGNNNYMPFDTTSFDSSIKHITIKGTPDVTRMTSFINILKDQTATGGATLDVSQLSDEIKNNLMADTTLATNAAAKGWVFIQQV